MMKLNINDLFSTNFSVSAEGAGLMKELRRNLGFESNYEVARLAIGLSMGQKNYPDNHRSGSAGSIRGNILFDKHDYPLWVGILLTNYINHHPEEIDNISMPMLQAVVKAHWDNGLFLLHDIWEQSNQNQHRFWEIILGKYVDLPNTDQYIHPHLDNSTMRPSSGAIKLVIGNMLRNSEEGEIFSHELNGSGYSPHIAIMGQAGSGKTRVMRHILNQIRRQAECSVILLDLGKGDLGNNTDLINSLGATVISVPEEPIPLDMFYIDNLSDNNETTAAMENFRDAFVQVAGKLGPKQTDNIREALLPFFRTHNHASFQQIREALEAFYLDNGLSKDSVISTINSLTLRDLFHPQYSPSVFFQKSWIITFANARADVKIFTVCLLLSALDYYLKRQKEAPLDDNEYRGLRLVLAIDEARELLSMNHSGLANNIRLHRSKGLSVILVSQSPDDYDGRKDDYLENIGLPLCLKTNAASPRSLKNMFKGDVNFSALRPGTCYTVDVKASRPVLLKLQFDSDD
ncbi:type IV secretion system DNA-binding domain-containing protein [uncultured Desulfovibrio sp.]|uniref:type IV secretion system DNA-binding domain-containing protein n=1 Tax=uncultured Desulfovibrio sp. TaxID=167968 RepID=UPI0025FBC2E0|nr:type IV secretion system DNA-binding domain-containing protein [uncultured Desulfovibrio sp.]